jgi:4-hydroxy-tetrahydrodipicolinate reductase
LQRKVGAGLSPAAFRTRVRQHQIGHVGLAESLAFLADALGWKLDRVAETIAPVVAPQAQRTQYLTVNRGAVAGIRQVARGYRRGRERLTLELQMFVGAKHPCDVIEIDGEPPMRVVVEGGVPGDIATPAILVNMLPQLMAGRPGWHTMRTLGLPHLAD